MEKLDSEAGKVIPEWPVLSDSTEQKSLVLSGVMIMDGNSN